MAKDKELKGMDAVIAKSEGRGRKPALKRKPGLAIMIAVGKPKGDEPAGKGRALNRALDRVKAPSDNESLLAELDDLNERVTALEKMMHQDEEADKESY